PGRFVRIATTVSVMVVVTMRLVVLDVTEALFAVEYQEVQTEGVQRGDEHTDQCGVVSVGRTPDTGFACGFDDVLFRVETREERRTHQSQRTDQESQPGNGHVLAQTTHIADVLIVVHTDNYRTSAQEQQGFEESVCHQVEHSGRVSRSTQSHRHVTQLGQGGVSHNALDVVLDNTQQAQEQGTGCTDHDDEGQRRCRLFKHRRETSHHEDTGR